MNRKRIIPLILLILFSLISLIGGNCSTLHRSFGGETAEYIASAVHFCKLFAAFLILYLIYDYLTSFLEKSGIQGIQIKGKKIAFAPTWSLLSFVILLVLFTACGMYYLRVFFPGTASWDTANQINDFFNGTEGMPFGFVEGQELVYASLNDHHPVFTALVYAFFTEVGIKLNNPDMGMFLCNFLQVVLSSAAFSFMLCAMDKLGIPAFFRRLGAVYIVFAPFIGLHMMCCMKDSMYAFLFVAYYVIYVLLIHDPEQYKKHIWTLLILSLLLALTKKTGIYLVILCNAGLLLYKPLKQYRKQILTSFLVPAAIILVIMPRLIYPAFNVFPGGKQEVLGILFQQTARLVRDGYELTDEEIETIDHVVDYEVLKNDYDPECNDIVKASYRLHCTSEDRNRYYLLWAKMFIQHPYRCIEATLTVSGGFFATDKVIDIFYKLPAADGTFSIFSTSPKYEQERDDIVEKYYSLTEHPVFGILFRIATYIWFLPGIALIRTAARKPKDLILFLPAAVSILILVVCPICYARYAISQLYVVPLLLGLSACR